MMCLCTNTNLCSLRIYVYVTTNKGARRPDLHKYMYVLTNMYAYEMGYIFVVHTCICLFTHPRTHTHTNTCTHSRTHNALSLPLFLSFARFLFFSLSLFLFRSFSLSYFHLQQKQSRLKREQRGGEEQMSFATAFEVGGIDFPAVCPIFPMTYTYVT